MHLHPFTLAETEAYLHRRGVTLDCYDVVQTYMLTGGVAYYLSYFHPGLSLRRISTRYILRRTAFCRRNTTGYLPRCLPTVRVTGALWRRCARTAMG